MDLVAALPKIMRFARTLTRSKTEAEDLVQRTCERALSRASQLRPDTKLESWLYRIMQTIWIDEMRARAVRSRYVAAVPRDELLNSVDGERQAEAALVLDRVRREMSKMPEADRRLLMMVCVDNLSYREAADALGVPIGTVMSRLSRARLDLATRLDMTRLDMTRLDKTGRSNTTDISPRSRLSSGQSPRTPDTEPLRLVAGLFEGVIMA